MNFWSNPCENPVIFFIHFSEHLRTVTEYQGITFHNVIATGVLLLNDKQQRGSHTRCTFKCTSWSVHKRGRTETTAVTLNNDLQKGGGTEALLYVLEAFILPVTNSGSLENVVKQGFDSSWPSWLLNPVILTRVRHAYIMNPTRDFSYPAFPCAFQSHF